MQSAAYLAEAYNALHRKAQHAFHTFFQKSSATVLQFGGGTPNGATNMYHLLSAIKAQADATPLAASQASLDPIAILSADSVNAFNATTRAQILSILQQGTAALVTLPDPSPPGTDKDPGWDFLWPYISAHYCCHGRLKFHHSGNIIIISSESGVQQGDPLCSTLFALAIHPILLQLGVAHPQVLFTAYADNVFMSGPLSHVQRAYVDYCQHMSSVGLQINARESEIYVPQWRLIPVDTLQAAHPSLHVNNAPEPGQPRAVYTMPNADNIPLTWEGLKVLGCPLGTPEFCRSHTAKVMTNIKVDLDLLAHLPALHQRTKLAIYCCNARISYLLRAISLDLSLDLMPSLDSYFDHFMAATLHFESDYARSHAAAQYRKALLQLRLRIQDGGVGLTSAVLTAPAASYVALREFFNWYCATATLWGDPALHLLPWLSGGGLQVERLQQLLPQLLFPRFL